MVDVIKFIFGNLQYLLVAILLIIDGLALLAALTPSKNDDEFIGKLQKFFSGLRKKDSNTPKTK